jgi:hypothetical protein
LSSSATASIAIPRVSRGIPPATSTAGDLVRVGRRRASGGLSRAHPRSAPLGIPYVTLVVAAGRGRGLTIASGGGASAVAGDWGDVPVDLDTVPDASHEGGEAAIGCLDGEPARGAVAGGAEGVGDLRWDGDESAGGDRDRLGFAPDLEGQLALEDVEGVGVLVVNVRAGYQFAR